MSESRQVKVIERELGVAKDEERTATSLVGKLKKELNIAKYAGVLNCCFKSLDKDGKVRTVFKVTRQVDNRYLYAMGIGKNAWECDSVTPIFVKADCLIDPTNLKEISQSEYMAIASGFLDALYQDISKDGE